MSRLGLAFASLFSLFGGGGVPPVQTLPDPKGSKGSAGERVIRYYYRDGKQAVNPRRQAKRKAMLLHGITGKQYQRMVRKARRAEKEAANGR